MLITVRNLSLLLAIPLLTACVHVDSRLQLVSNAEATSSGTAQACDLKPVMDSPAEYAHGLDPESIAFLNWNIYKGNGENWQQDLSSFAQDHDVMTMQEATLDEELTSLLETNNFSWIMNTAFHFNGTAAGVMTAAHSDAVHSCGFKDQEPLLRIPKSTLVSYYRINGSEEKLLVANIHGINFTFGVSNYHQQLETLYAAIEHHDGPMIVAGDFNSWSEVRMAEVEQLVTRLGLSKIVYPVNNKTHIFGNAIDHVFYRNLEIITNQVIQVSSSDHNPISVNFRFQPTVLSSELPVKLYSSLNSATNRR